MSQDEMTPQASQADSAVSVSGKPPEHFIVLVPGFMGSMLRDKNTKKVVWIDFSQAGLNPLNWQEWVDQLAANMRYPNDNLEPAGIVQDVLFLPPWIKMEQYSRLLRTLTSWGYKTDPNQFPEEELNVYAFAYDWRQDNRISGKQLAQAVERWSAMHPGAEVWLMGHSNGGIVSRWFIEKEGGKDKVKRLFLLASPWDGAVKAVYMLFQGLDVVFRQKFNLFGLPERTRETLRTFPGAYQLIPQSREFLQDADGNPLSIFDGPDWGLSERERELLEDGRRFNQELGNHLSVETIAFFGRKLMTTDAGRVHLGPDSLWERVDWADSQAGDGTLPEYTAIFADTDRNIPVVAEHGDIYVNQALYEILRWELVDKYSEAGTASISITSGKYLITFNSDQDVYAPGQEIKLWATIHNKEGKPVARASVAVSLVWRQALPGSADTKPAAQLAPVAFAKDKHEAGRWEATIPAPATEGYYQLEGVVKFPSGDTVEMNAMIAVEAP